MFDKAKLSRHFMSSLDFVKLKKLKGCSSEQELEQSWVYPARSPSLSTTMTLFHRGFIPLCFTPSLYLYLKL